MNCGKCNSPVPDGYKFCTHCGQPMPAAAILNAPTVVNQPPAAAPTVIGQVVQPPPKSTAPTNRPTEPSSGQFQQPQYQQPPQQPVQQSSQPLSQQPPQYQQPQYQQPQYQQPQFQQPQYQQPSNYQQPQPPQYQQPSNYQQPPQYQQTPPQQQYSTGQGVTMKYTIEHGGAFALAVLSMQPEQSIKAEAGAMVSMTPNIEMISQAQGGIMGVLKRAVVGESAFINTFTSRGGPGELTLAPSSPGDIAGIELNNQTYFVQSGSFLASSPSIELDLKFGGAKSFFSGEGLFLIKLWGSGTLLLSSFGAIREKQLAPGERYIVDTGHIVAFEGSVQYSIRKASQQGFLRNMVSGEGYICEYTGPGKIFLQTRNLSAFVSILKPFFPNQSGSGGGFKIDF